MNELCIDASLAVKMVIVEQFTPETEKLFDGCAQKGITIIAPSIWDPASRTKALLTY